MKILKLIGALSILLVMQEFAFTQQTTKPPT